MIMKVFFLLIRLFKQSNFQKNLHSHIFIFFIDLTSTVAMVIENGGKIGKMSFWKTIWRFHRQYF